LVTSADRLNADWSAAERARREGDYFAESHIEMLLAPLPRHCGIVSVIDGHPATLAWLGRVRGHRVSALGVEHFGQTGTIEDLYRHHGIDTDSTQRVADGLKELCGLGAPEGASDAPLLRAVDPVTAEPPEPA
jgi:pyruvate dehydrogenase E1 component